MRKSRRSPLNKYLLAACCGWYILPRAIYRKTTRYITTTRNLRETRKHELPSLQGKKRKRALSLPLEKPAGAVSRLLGGAQRTDAQRGCALLSKLPVEVRLVIWEYALGGYRVPIEPWLGGIRERERRVENWWAVVRTCRVVYSETIDMLYATTLFDAKSVAMLNQLKDSVLEKRWSRIRELRVTVSFSPKWISTSYGCVRSGHYVDVVKEHEIANWELMCEILGTMEGLRRLKLSLFDPRQLVGCTRLEALRRLEAQVVVEMHSEKDLGEELRTLGDGNGQFRVVDGKKLRKRAPLAESELFFELT